MVIRYFKARRDSIRAKKLELLDRLLVLLKGSSDSGFSVLTVNQLIDDTLKARLAIESGDHKANEMIARLFVPTGSMQDTSIDNGWSDEFLELANHLC